MLKSSQDLNERLTCGSAVARGAVLVETLVTVSWARPLVPEEKPGGSWRT